MGKFKFLDYLRNKASTEEEVKYAYVKHFGLEFSTKKRADCLTGGCLFEFKYSVNFGNVKALAKVLAQTLYYVQRAKYRDGAISVPSWIVLADKASVVIARTTDWVDFCGKDYNWLRQASSPDQKLVEDLQNAQKFKELVILDLQSDLTNVEARIANVIASKDVPPQKVVDEDNFEQVFSLWSLKFGECVAANTAQYFIADLANQTMYNPTKGTLVFLGKTAEEFHIPFADHKAFWETYKRPPTAKAMELILSRKDRLDKLAQRRLTGEYFTPLKFAKLGLDYIEKALGPNWQDEYYVFDPAAGTGNLEYGLKDYKNVFMSTLEAHDVQYIKTMFPGVTCWQYNYLQDDVDLVFQGKDLLDDTLGWKLPRAFRKALADPSKKWVVLVNPPFAEATDGIASGAKKKGAIISGVSGYMKNGGTGELFCQFLARIHKELPKSFLCLYSTLKYLQAPKSAKLRDSLKLEYKGGFMFPCSVFNGTKGSWPVATLCWRFDTGKTQTEIAVDMYDKECVQVGRRVIQFNSKLNKLRPASAHSSITCSMPPLSNAIKVKTSKYSREHVPASTVGFLVCNSNDLQNAATGTALFSSVFSCANRGVCIAAMSLSEVATAFTVRKVTQHKWYNDRDQFRKPTIPLTQEFIDDCLVYMLFNGSNQTSAMKDVKYKDNVYQIHNQFFPFSVAKVKGWNPPVSVYSQLRNAKDTFVCEELAKRALSKEAQKVLALGESLYQEFYANLSNLNQTKWKIAFWDNGWYQVRNALAEKKMCSSAFKNFKAAYEELTLKLRPQVFHFGYLDEVKLFEEEV